MSKIKYLIMDIDGSLTDGKIYMGPIGEAMKAFSIKDGMVFNYILKPEGITPIVMTARESSIVQQRCNELGIKEVYQGKLDKYKALSKIVGTENLGSCAYFGDDIIDLSCMIPIKESGGVVGCPSDAVQEVKASSDYICLNKAGEGALREFCEWLVRPENDETLDSRISKAIEYLKSISLDDLEIGKTYHVDNNFFYSVQSYYTKPETECFFESHKQYVDIQIIINGFELMDIADISRLKMKEDYDLHKDIILWNNPLKNIRVKLSEGDFIILYPENAHRGAVAESDSCKIVKIVGKVKI